MNKTPPTYIEKWKSRMKEVFGRAAANTKQRRYKDKRKRDQKARLQPLEVGGRVLVRNLNEKGGPGKTRAFWTQKVYKLLKKKDEDAVYAVRVERDPHARLRVLHRNNLLSCQEFQSFENTNMQAQIPSKSAGTREAKRKEHSNYLEERSK